jgi:hypothetical protein
MQFIITGRMMLEYVEGGRSHQRSAPISYDLTAPTAEHAAELARQLAVQRERCAGGEWISVQCTPCGSPDTPASQ